MSINDFLPSSQNSATERANNFVNSSNNNIIINDSNSKNGKFNEKSVIPEYPYRNLNNWIPKDEDFLDGGAFPEILIAQYPKNMGKKDSLITKGNALVNNLDSNGNLNYTNILKNNTNSSKKIIQSSYKDLIPINERNDLNELNISHKPYTEEEINYTKEKTKNAFDLIWQKKSVSKGFSNNNNNSTNKNNNFIKYTPANINGLGKQRIIQIVDKQIDPLEPPKFQNRKIPKPPPSPPVPILHSPPKKLTKEDHEQWYIPPSVSNWKNPKGFTIALDKRLAADGRRQVNLDENLNSISNKFASFTEALNLAEQQAREEIRVRNLLEKKQKERDRQEHEERLKRLAKEAREARHNYDNDRDRDRDYDNYKYSNNEDERIRNKIRAQNSKEAEKELRKSRMGNDRKLSLMARENNDRDISERIALGVAKPSASSGSNSNSNNDSLYDARLFSKSTSSLSNNNSSDVYDKPLFLARDAVSSIYKFSSSSAANVSKYIQDESENSIKNVKTFAGVDSNSSRDGPVQFEKSQDDPFGLKADLEDITQSVAMKGKHGLQDMEDSKPKRSKFDDE